MSPTDWPEPGSAEELARFETLMGRLPSVYEHFDDPLAYRTVVVVPSTTFDQRELATNSTAVEASGAAPRPMRVRVARPGVQVGLLRTTRV